MASSVLIFVPSFGTKYEKVHPICVERSLKIGHATNRDHKVMP